MKKIFTFLLLSCMPMMSFGLGDACTKPNEFTIDKRCYVTDEQKRQTPYNAVVGLIDGDDEPYCTGTLVYEGGRELYLLTAKHCTVDENDLVKQKLRIRLQDGSKFDVTKVKVGDYDIKNDENLNGDYAVYRVDIEKGLPMVGLTNKESIGFGPFTYEYNARVVGYGALKIMSDKKIADFKNKYIQYLENKRGVVAKGYETMYGFYNEDGIFTRNGYVVNFLGYLRGKDLEYYGDVFNNLKLKVSYCKYSSNGKQIGCQTWSGNSGGPIFDDKNAIMGILTRSVKMIGGENHAGAEYQWFDMSTSSIPLLR